MYSYVLPPSSISVKQSKDPNMIKDKKFLSHISKYLKVNMK